MGVYNPAPARYLSCPGLFATDNNNISYLTKKLNQRKVVPMSGPWGRKTTGSIRIIHIEFSSEFANGQNFVCSHSFIHSSSPRSLVVNRGPWVAYYVRSTSG